VGFWLGDKGAGVIADRLVEGEGAGILSGRAVVLVVGVAEDDGGDGNA
jgi:hypothetical protein